MRGETLFGLALTPALRGLAIRLAYGGALATLAAGALLLCVDRGGEPQARAARRAIVLFALVLFLGLFPSAIWSHLAFVLAPVLLVLALVADRVDAALRARLRALALAWRGSLLALALAATALAVHISLDVPRWYPTPLDLPRGSLRVSAQQHALLHGATQFLVRCAGPDEKVFVAPDLPLLYFLANRRNPTPYDLVIPGAIDGERIVERLRESGTRCVVYNPQIYSQFAPFAELFPEVAEVLARDYRRVATIGSAGAEWHALVRREPGGA
jgi:hypothetical protein